MIFCQETKHIRRQSLLVLARVGALFSDRGEADSAQRQLFFPLASLNLASPVWERKFSFYSLRSLFQRRDFSHLHSLLHANVRSLGSHMALRILPFFFLMKFILCIAIPWPVLPFSLRLIWSRRKAPWDASNAAVIFQYPQRIEKQSLIRSPLPSPLLLICTPPLSSPLRI